MHDLVNIGSHGMASEDDPLYYDLPSRTLLYIFSLYIHHPWNTWSTYVNIQYAKLEDKEITQRLAIYCDQGSTAACNNTFLKTLLCYQRQIHRFSLG